MVLFYLATKVTRISFFFHGEFFPFFGNHFIKYFSLSISSQVLGLYSSALYNFTLE